MRRELDDIGFVQSNCEFLRIWNNGQPISDEVVIDKSTAIEQKEIWNMMWNAFVMTENPAWINYVDESVEVISVSGNSVQPTTPDAFAGYVNYQPPAPEKVIKEIYRVTCAFVANSANKPVCKSTLKLCVELHFRPQITWRNDTEVRHWSEAPVLSQFNVQLVFQLFQRQIIIGNIRTDRLWPIRTSSNRLMKYDN